MSIIKRFKKQWFRLCAWIGRIFQKKENNQFLPKKYKLRPLEIIAQVWQGLEDPVLHLPPNNAPNTAYKTMCHVCGERVLRHGKLNDQIVCPHDYIVNGQYPMNPLIFEQTFQEYEIEL